MAQQLKAYTLGKGVLRFDRFPSNVVTSTTQGIGERDMGNCPSFTINTTSEELEHFSSRGGVKELDANVTLSTTRAANITCDNVTPENIARIFLGESADLVEAPASAVVHNLPVAKRGHYYQIGTSLTTPSGVRNISNVAVNTTTPTLISQVGNYEVDAERGTIFILDDAPDIDDIELNVTYDVAGSTRSQIISGKTTISGALRYIADNTGGENIDYYMPYVTLSPSGDISLIGDEWMTLSFSCKVLVKAQGIAALYGDSQSILT